MQFTQQTLITLALGFMTVQLTESMPTRPYGDAASHHESGSMPTRYRHKSYEGHVNGSYGGSDPHYNEHDQMPHYSGDNTEDCDDGNYGHHDENDNSGYGASHNDNSTYGGNGKPNYYPSGNDMGAPYNGDNMPTVEDAPPAENIIHAQGTPTEELPANGTLPADAAPTGEPALSKRSVPDEIFNTLFDKVERQPTRMVDQLPQFDEETDSVSDNFPSLSIQLNTPLGNIFDDFPLRGSSTDDSDRKSFDTDEVRRTLRSVERQLKDLNETERSDSTEEGDGFILEKRGMGYDSTEECEDDEPTEEYESEDPEHYWGDYNGDMEHEMPSYEHEDPTEVYESEDPEHHWGGYNGDAEHEMPSYGNEEDMTEECEEETPDHHWEYYEGEMDHETPSYEVPSEDCEDQEDGEDHSAYWKKEQPAPMDSGYVKGWKKSGNHWEKIVRKVSDKTGETTYYKIIKVIVPWKPHQEDEHMPHYPTEPAHEEEEHTDKWYPHQGKGHVTKMYKKISKVENHHYTGESNEGLYHATSEGNSYVENDNGQHHEDTECEEDQTNSGEYPSQY